MTNSRVPLFTATASEAVVDRAAHAYNFKERQQRLDHGHSFTYPDEDRIFRNMLRQERADAKVQIIALAKQLDVDPGLAIWMLPGHGEEEAFEEPPPVVLQKDKKLKKRKPLVTEEIEPAPVMPPIILKSLQHPAATTIRDEMPIVPESPVEAIRRLEWQACDIAIRKRRGVL